MSDIFSWTIEKMQAFSRDQSGATSIEYSLTAAIISIALIGGLSRVSLHSGDQMENIADSLQGDDYGGPPPMGGR